MQLPPTALLVVAEIKIAALIAALFLPVSFSIAVLVLVALIAAIAILGGMRSLTWTASAEFLVGAVGLTVVVTTVSIILTNVPAPQLTYGEMFSSLHNAEITAGLYAAGARRARDRFAGRDAGADGQALPATLRQSRSDGFRHAVSQPRARHGGAAEPFDAKRRDQLDRRSAPLDRLGAPVRGLVRHDGPGHRRLRQAHRLPRHCAGLGILASRLAHRTRRQAPAAGRRRQRRRRDRRGRAARSAATALPSRCHGRPGCLTCPAC